MTKTLRKCKKCKSYEKLQNYACSVRLKPSHDEQEEAMMSRNQAKASQSQISAILGLSTTLANTKLQMQCTVAPLQCCEPSKTEGVDQLCFQQ